jgi:tetrahydromethanopterin S-methyltransferase subunit H
MFVFKKEQQIYDFGGVQIGGHPGENPTVLIGGMFFKGQPIVDDTREGTFDKDLAKEWIEVGNLMQSETGHPLILEVYGRTPQAIERHLAWTADNFDGPIMFESVNSRARIRGIEYCDEAGLSNRTVFNSIMTSMKPEEQEALKNSRMDKAVVLGWSPKTVSLAERMEVIMDLLTTAGDLSIDKVLVDPGTVPIGAGYGLGYRTNLAIKSELGLPTCLAPHNAPSAWDFLKRPEFNLPETHTSAVVASTVAAQLFATDAIFFGSMIRAREVFTAVSLMANAMFSALGEANRAMGIDRALFDPESLKQEGKSN